MPLIKRNRFGFVRVGDQFYQVEFPQQPPPPQNQRAFSIVAMARREKSYAKERKRWDTHLWFLFSTTSNAWTNKVSFSFQKRKFQDYFRYSSRLDEWFNFISIVITLNKVFTDLIPEWNKIKWLFRTTRQSGAKQRSAHWFLSFSDGFFPFGLLSKIVHIERIICNRNGNQRKLRKWWRRRWRKRRQSRKVPHMNRTFICILRVVPIISAQE